MRLAAISLVLAACIWLTAGDVAHLKSAKARLISRLASKHHKRGIYSAVPPFKLGHDIPHVTHSLVKPLVVTYPPTATVAAVKVPLSRPLGPRFPISVGHRFPQPHAHFGQNFHHQTKNVLLPKPDHHFHHHHHHVEPKPLVPVLPAPPVVHATPTVPVAQPSGVNVVHPLPAPSPPVLVHPAPEPAIHAQPFPIPPPPLHLLRPQHVPLKSLVPIAPIQPANAIAAPAFPLTHQFPYVIRPGNAVQTSFFATYPRYPLVNYQSPLVPFAPAAPTFNQVLLNRPQVLLPEAAHAHGVIEHHQHPSVIEPTPTFLHPTQATFPQPAIHLQPVQPTVHLQPAQPTVHFTPQPTVHVQATQPAVSLDHNGWSPVTAQHDFTPVEQPEGHFPQPIDAHHFTQEQGTQVFEHHTGNEQQFHDQQFHDQQYHDQQFHDQQFHDQQFHDQQLHNQQAHDQQVHDQQVHDQQYHNYQNLQHHIQQQLDQAQYEQHLNNQHQLNQEYGAPQQEYGQPTHDFSQQSQDFAQHAHEYAQHVQEYAQHGQEYAQTNEYNLQQQQPTPEYGVPQQLEGRSAEGEGEGEPQRFHNHIPLGLQPPIDRPLEHFR